MLAWTRAHRQPYEHIWYIHLLQHVSVTKTISYKSVSVVTFCKYHRRLCIEVNHTSDPKGQLGCRSTKLNNWLFLLLQFCLVVLHCSSGLIAIMLCLTNGHLKCQLIHQLKNWWFLRKNADCLLFSLNCALLFKNRGDIFDDFPPSYMQMKA